MIKTTMTCFFICFTVATKLLWPEKTKCVFSEGKYWIPFQLRNSHLLSTTQQCPSHRTVSSPKSETLKSSTLTWHKRKYFHKSTFFICFFCAKYFILRSIRTAPLGELVGMMVIIITKSNGQNLICGVSSNLFGGTASRSCTASVTPSTYNDTVIQVIVIMINHYHHHLVPRQVVIQVDQSIILQMFKRNCKYMNDHHHHHLVSPPYFQFSPIYLSLASCSLSFYISIEV